MVFTSVLFVAIFLPLVIATYFSHRNVTYRNVVLMLFSLAFYSWGEPSRVLIMIATVGINYLCAVGVDRARTPFLRRLCMLLGVGVSLSILVFYKYYAFFANNVSAALGLSYTAEPQRLPIGISFYTFQVLTYTLDVYRGKVPLMRNPIKLCLYVSFFPQLIAGPIVNYKDIADRLGERTITIDRFSTGIQRFMIGFAKKTLIANLCGEMLNGLATSGALSWMGAWLSAIAFAFQMYFDYSAYSDMAIGMGHMFGFHFRENFRYPYACRSMSDFWRRWHISLGAFFREYVYIPLGGSRVGPIKTYRNIMIVWILTGLWHGASWNYVLWGVFFGLLLVIERAGFGRVLDRLPPIGRRLYALLMVAIGMVLFYHESLADGWRHVGALFGIGVTGLADPATLYYFKAYIGFLVIALFACVPWKSLLFRRVRLSPEPSVDVQSPLTTVYVLKSIVVTAIFGVSIAFLIGQSFNPFLYFRF